MNLINITIGVIIALAGLALTIRTTITYFKGRSPFKSFAGVLFFTVNMIHLGLIFIFGFS